MKEPATVYLVIHELFGIISRSGRVRLVTPDVSACTMQGHPGHTYKIGRFKDGKWLPDRLMAKGATYTLQGVTAGKMTAAKTPPHPEYNAHPPGNFAASKIPPYCQWDLLPPDALYQLRLLSIPVRPLFTGDPEGNAVERQIQAIGLVQVFAYTPESSDFKGLQIVDDKGETVDINYAPDVVTNTVNLHIWAEIEDESGMDDKMAEEHSKCATRALRGLFEGLHLDGQRSLATDNWYPTQLSMPAGVRFVELLTLGELFALRHGDKDFKILCTAKTCGHGSNVFVEG
jgi:hypothetical protein